MTIGDLISSQRKKLGYTLEDVGKAVGVNKGTVLRWETGAIHTMKRDKIAALSRFLQMDPTLFIMPQEVLTAEERDLVSAYRAADAGTQASVRKLLDLPEEKNTAESAIS